MRGIRLLIALMRADAYGSGAFGPDVARAARLLAAAGRVTLLVVVGVGLGLAAWFVGFFWLAPARHDDAFEGAVIAGLLGLLGGLAWGLLRERRRHPA